MSVTSIASAATTMAAERDTTQLGITMLKKALDAQSSTAAQLISALPKPPGGNLPPNLGQNVNTVA